MQIQKIEEAIDEMIKWLEENQDADPEKASER